MIRKIKNKFISLLRNIFLKSVEIIYSNYDSESSLINSDYVRKLIALSYPMGHHDKFMPLALLQADPGLGLLYYSLARTLKPQNIVCIGSFRGFSFVSFALGLKDNKSGHLFFVDPSFVDDFWKNKKGVNRHLNNLGVKKKVTLINSTTQEAVKSHKIFAGKPFIDILFIDGDHTYEGVKFDFENIGAFVKDSGYMLFHDANSKKEGFTNHEAWKLIKEIDRKKYELLTLNVGSGLAILRKIR